MNLRPRDEAIEHLVQDGTRETGREARERDAAAVVCGRSCIAMSWVGCGQVMTRVCAMCVCSFDSAGARDGLIVLKSNSQW